MNRLDRVQEIGFNSLFEMPGRATVVGGKLCLATGFNSLFEMPTVYLPQWKTLSKEQVSILCLRCPRGTYKLYTETRISFNSLFEMRIQRRFQTSQACLLLFQFSV